MAWSRVVGQKAKNSGAGTSTVVLTLPGTPTNGNALRITTSSLSSVGSRVTSIAQTGATWTKSTEGVNSTLAGCECEIWQADNVSGASATITVTFATSQPHGAIVQEYTGGLNSSSLDQVASTTGSGSPVSSGTTPTTTYTGELFIAALVVGGSVTSGGAPTNSFNVVDSVIAAGALALEMCDNIVSSTQTASTSDTFTPNSGQLDVGCIATFKDNGYTPPVTNNAFLAFM